MTKTRRPGDDPAYDAAAMLEGLETLPPADRLLAEGRLIEELERVLAERCASALETEALLAAVVEAIKARART